MNKGDKFFVMFLTGMFIIGFWSVIYVLLGFELSTIVVIGSVVTERVVSSWEKNSNNKNKNKDD